MTIYTAEDVGGSVFLVAAWGGLSRESFKEFVLDNLSRNSIPEPDRNIQQLELFEWADEGAFARAYQLVAPNPPDDWKEAYFATLYWTYPGVWSETNVTRMPPELAAEFWDGEGVDRTDPKHPEWLSTLVDADRQGREIH